MYGFFIVLISYPINNQLSWSVLITAAVWTPTLFLSDTTQLFSYCTSMGLQSFLIKFCIGQLWEQSASPFERSSSSKQSTERNRERDMRVAWEISVSPRASLGISSALCLPHMSVRNVQTDRKTDSHTCKQTDGWKIRNKEEGGQPGRGKGKR